MPTLTPSGVPETVWRLLDLLFDAPDDVVMEDHLPAVIRSREALVFAESHGLIVRDAPRGIRGAPDVLARPKWWRLGEVARRWIAERRLRGADPESTGRDGDSPESTRGSSESDLRAEIAKAEQDYTDATAALLRAGADERSAAEKALHEVRMRLDALVRKRRGLLCSEAWGTGRLEPVEDDDGHLLYPTQADIPSRVGWLLKNMHQFIGCARLCQRLPSGDFEAGTFIRPLRRIHEDMVLTAALVQSAAPVDWDPQTPEEEAAGFQRGRPRVGRGNRDFPDTLDAILRDITFCWLANVQETGIVPLATVEKLERLLIPLERNLQRWADDRKKPPSAEPAGTLSGGPAEYREARSSDATQAGDAGDRENRVPAGRGDHVEALEDPPRVPTKPRSGSGESTRPLPFNHDGAELGSTPPWQAAHAGGMPARGWAEIMKTVAAENTEARQKMITRLNEQTMGPITWCGGVPEADRGEVLAWIEDTRARAEAAETRRQEAAETVQDLDVRDGAGLPDHSLQKEARPNARGKAK